MFFSRARMTSEFELIEKYFSQQPVRRDDVIIGVGDDGAVLRTPADRDLVVSTDTLVEGVHFIKDCAPPDLGYRALAVNLSDLAAMGAEPAWVTLAITAPSSEESWFRDFSRGFFELAAAHGVQLVGGNLARGPLSVTVAVHGFVPRGRVLRRNGAQVGDVIFVTGTLGDAALGLQIARGEGAKNFGAEKLRQRYLRPTPRLNEGLALREVASACIDVSDGLLADLGHIVDQSGVGAALELAQLPLSTEFRQLWTGDWSVPLFGGDDYELCFTVPPGRADKVSSQVNATRIGAIEAQSGIRCVREDRSVWIPERRGYDHFR